MKAILIALASVGILGLGLGGCADGLEKPIGDEAQEKFQRGITGQGTIGPLDRPENDPANNHGVPQTHP